MRYLLFLIVPALLFFGCNNNSKDKKKNTDTSTVKENRTLDTVEKNRLLKNLSAEIMVQIRNKDYQALANYVHPVYGLRFTPYAFVDTLKDVKFSPEKFSIEVTKVPQSKINWGEFDGTGDPISLTIDEYFGKFVYPADFLNAESFKVNEFIGSGSMINNLKEVYKGCDFTESHFSGFDKKYDGMDWKSLRLVFNQIEGKYYLVGIVNDQWTI